MALYLSTCYNDRTLLQIELGMLASNIFNLRLISNILALLSLNRVIIALFLDK